MTPLSFTHLTLKRPVTVTKELVMAVWAADSLGGTYIVGNGGAIVPVQETPEVVRAKVYGPNDGNQKATQKGSRSR